MIKVSRNSITTTFYLRGIENFTPMYTRPHFVATRDESWYLGV